MIREFYTWGDVRTFSDVDAAIGYCRACEVGLAIFIVDVYLKGKSGFFFLDAVEKRFRSAHQDAIIVTGKASNEIVDVCVASGVHYLLEKPIKKYALQLAVRSIVAKYMYFSKMLLEDPEFASTVKTIEGSGARPS
jgi:DNA-binding NarL/FixJ family response regulator